MSDFTPEQKLTYYTDKLAHWMAKEKRLLRADKKKHAAKRIAHYMAKVEAGEKAAKEAAKA